MPVSAIASLIQTLERLPSLGNRSAAKIAYHLLQSELTVADDLISSLQSARQNTRQCSLCNNFSESDICSICASEKRDAAKICIVSMPWDVDAIENSHAFNGHYFVLMGSVSAFSEESSRLALLDKLAMRLSSLTQVEVLLAFDQTNDGQLLSYLVAELLDALSIPYSRLQKGMALGDDIDMVLPSSLAFAFESLSKA